MMKVLSKFVRIALAVGVALAGAGSAQAALVISEVDPFGSNPSDGYSADWFELTNTGTQAVSIAGYTMIDSHATTASSTQNPYTTGTISVSNDSKGAPAPLSIAGGATTIAAGQTVIFLESNSNAAGSATLISNFEKTWFGSSVPTNLTVGVFDDSGNYGLGQGNAGDIASDMVNIFNGSSTSASLVASVAFGVDSGSPIATFDNTAGANNAVLTTKSVVGVNGAFLSSTGAEIGSPGVDAAPVPLPAGAWMLVSGLGGLSLLRRRRKTA